MSPRFVLALVLLVLVRAGGFSSIVAVVWFRDVYSAGGAALVLSAFGVGTVVFPALAGLLVRARTLTPVLAFAMAVNGVLMLLLPAAVGGPLAITVVLMLLVGAMSGASRSLLGTLITFASSGSGQTRVQSTIAWAANLGAAAASAIAGLVTATSQQYGMLFAVEGVILLAVAPIALALGPAAVPNLGAWRTLRLGDVRVLGCALAVGIGATALMQGLGTAFALLTRHPEAFVSAALLNGVLILVLQPMAVRLLRDDRATAYLVGGSLAGVVTALAAALTDSWVVLGVGWTVAELLLSAGMVPTILARTPHRLHVAAIGVVGSSWGLSAAALPVLVVSSSALAGPAAGWSLLVGAGLALVVGVSLPSRRAASVLESER